MGCERDTAAALVMTYLPPRVLILYILIPAVNLLTWYYVGLSNALYFHPSCDDIYSRERVMRLTERQIQMSARPCDYTDLNVDSSYSEAMEGDRDRGIMGYKGCHPVINPAFESPIERVKTKDFDEYRSARLAPMITLKGEI